ncbi:competence/damage-inducible domain protein CinA [Eubacterium sp. CAG:192]|nr:competence/damage-inducible domain protein CinA [Eubacterium sp. CAG:192]
MAEACSKAYKSDIGIGVTGTMGNVDPLNKEASILGEVFFAITINGETRAYYIELPPQPTRLAYKLAVAKEIYDALMATLK